MIFPRDLISNHFHKPSRLEKLEMARRLPPVKKHSLEGAGIVDSLSTSKQFGGVADQAEEWNFILSHLSTVTSMGALGVIIINLGILLYCSSKSCWMSIWRAITYCRCIIGLDLGQPHTLTTISTILIAVTSPSAQTQGEIEALE